MVVVLLLVAFFPLNILLCFWVVLFWFALAGFLSYNKVFLLLSDIVCLSEFL